MGRARIGRRSVSRLPEAFRLAEEEHDPIGCLQAAGAACIAVFHAAEEFERLDAWFDATAPLLESGMRPALTGLTALLVYSGAMIALMRRPAHPLARRCESELMTLMTEPIDVNQRISGAAAFMLYLCYTGDIHAARRLEATIEPLLQVPELTPLNRAFWYADLGYASVVENTPARGHAALVQAEAIGEREGFGFVLTVS